MIMYTTCTPLNDIKQPKKMNAKKVFLDHKTISKSLNFKQTANTPTTTYVASIFYTSTPFNGLNDEEVALVSNMSIQSALNILGKTAVGQIDFHTKVREKDKTILTDIHFNVPTNIATQEFEQTVWKALKMLTLYQLINHPKYGKFIAVNDAQMHQLMAFIESFNQAAA